MCFLPPKFYSYKLHIHPDPGSGFAGREGCIGHHPVYTVLFSGGASPGGAQDYALSYYNSVKSAAKMNVAGAKVIEEDLGQRFEGNAKRSSPPAELNLCKTLKKTGLCHPVLLYPSKLSN